MMMDRDKSVLNTSFNSPDHPLTTSGPTAQNGNDRNGHWQNSSNAKNPDSEDNSGVVRQLSGISDGFHSIGSHDGVDSEFGTAESSGMTQEKRNILFHLRRQKLDKPKFLIWTVPSKGVATFLFIVLFLSLLFLFAALFELVEAPAEKTRNRDYVDMMSRIRVELSPELFAELEAYIGVDATTGTQHFVEYDHITEDWVSFTALSYFSSFYYTFAIATTIGYGDIVTYTNAGKLLTCVCIFATLPVAIVTYTKVADFVSFVLMKLIMKRQDEFKTVLRKYDKDGSKTLDKHELRMAFRDLGMDLSDQEVMMLINQYDDNGDEVLDVEEFAHAATQLDVRVGKVARNALKLRFACVALLLFVIIFTVLAGVVMALDAVDSIYFSVVTLTTVGLGDITPPPAARAPLTIPIFIALGLVALVIGIITEEHEERIQYELDQLQDEDNDEFQEAPHEPEVAPRPSIDTDASISLQFDPNQPTNNILSPKYHDSNSTSQRQMTMI